MYRGTIVIVIAGNQLLIALGKKSIIIAIKKPKIKLKNTKL